MTYQFSRINPPHVIIPVNNNHLGAHNELIPTNVEPLPPQQMQYLKKSRVIQRVTAIDDPNKAKPTPLHPAYQSQPTDKNNVQGKAMNSYAQPIIF